MAHDNDFAPEWLQFEQELGARPVFSGDLDDIKKQFEGLGQLIGPQFPLPNPLIKVEDRKIDSDVNVRIYSPPAIAGQSLPIGVYFHGGGFVLGDLNTEDADCRYFAQHTPCIIVAVDFRCAPDNKFPAILGDCVAGYAWAWQNAVELGGTQDRVVAIGASAGACLALAVVNQLISKSQGGKIRGVVALSPITAHPKSVPAKYKDVYKSYEENAVGAVVDTHALELFFTAVNFDPHDPTMFIMLSDHLNAFPPTYIVTAGMDTLRDDGVIFEMALKEKGIAVKRDHYSGFPHCFWIFPKLNKRDILLADATEGLKFVLSVEKKSS